MRVKSRSVAVVAALVATATLTASCTIDSETQDAPVAAVTSGSAAAALQGAEIRVGSKEFDEQLLLGQIAIIALQAAGAKPVDETNITGSDNVRKALTGDEIDLYWEYTGTGWVSFLKKDESIPDPEKLFDAVKKADTANDITWWARSPANNTYAIAANQSVIDKHGIKTLSDYAALVKQTPADAGTCMGPEFKSRDDGFAGLSKKYGFQLPAAQEHLVNDAVVYTTAGEGKTCVFASVAATDGRVAAQKLTVLEDDRDFFPVYNPAITIRTSVAEKYPELEAVFTPIAEKLDSDTLTELNKKISVDGEDANAVAKEWMQSEGLIG